MMKCSWLVWLLLPLSGLANEECPQQAPPPTDAEIYSTHNLAPDTLRPMLYRLSRAAKKGYLFGTTHLGPPLIYQPAPQVLLAVRRSQVILIEALADRESIQQWQNLSNSGDKSTLRQGLGTALYQRYIALAQKKGLEESQAERLRPWAAMLAIGSPRNRGLGLDQQILSQARSAGRRIVPMQSLSDIANALDSQPLKDQLIMLRDTVCQSAALPQYLSQLARIYASGDPDLLHTFSHWGHEKDAIFNRFDRALVQQRNHAFLQKLDAEIDLHNVFLSVGAEHLVGPEGLIQLLRDKGYRVSATP